MIYGVTVAIAEPVSNNNVVNLVCSPSRIADVLAVAIGLLVAAGVLVEVLRFEYGFEGQLFNLLNLDGEKNLPALISGLLMLVAALFAWLVSRTELMQTYLRHWRVLSVGLFVMALDEVFSFHERLIEPVQALVGHSNLGVFRFSWVIPALLLLPILAIYFYPFIRDLPARTRTGFCLSGGLFLGGSVGMEMVGGRHFDLYGSTLQLAMIASLEEAFELFGIGYFIYSAVNHISENGRAVELRFVSRTQASAIPRRTAGRYAN